MKNRKSYSEVKEMLKGYFKIADSYGSFCSVVMYNPSTKDYKKINVRDYDYEYIYDGLTANYDEKILDELYYMDINKEVLLQYKIDNGIVAVGMEIEIVKGRKYPKGTKGTVVKKYSYKDKYGRWLANYIITDTGMKVNVANVKIVK